MSSVICLIAFLPETVVSLREVRAVRTGPGGVYSPAIIGTVAKDGKGREVALPLSIMEPLTPGQRKETRESILRQVNTLFDNYEATHGGKENEAVGKPDPGGQGGKSSGKEDGPSLAGANGEATPRAPFGPDGIS